MAGRPLQIILAASTEEKNINPLTQTKLLTHPS